MLCDERKDWLGGVRPAAGQLLVFTVTRSNPFGVCKGN